MGVNAAGLLCKLESFEALLQVERPSVFCVQETKVRKKNMIKTESTRNYEIYELLRTNKDGGGLCIGVSKDLQPSWVDEGDDEVECLSVEIWVNGFPIRIVTAYGPQLGDTAERKQKFWEFLDTQARQAYENGSGFILQMDSNSHLGQKVIKDGPNNQNANGKLFCDYFGKIAAFDLNKCTTNM